MKGRRRAAPQIPGGIWFELSRAWTRSNEMPFLASWCVKRARGEGSWRNKPLHRPAHGASLGRASILEVGLLDNSLLIGNLSLYYGYCLRC